MLPWWPAAVAAVLVVPAMWVLGAANWDLNTALAIGQHVRLYDLLEDALPALLLAAIFAGGVLTSIQDARAARGWARFVRWPILVGTVVIALGVGLVSGRVAFLSSCVAVAVGIGLTRRLWRERPHVSTTRIAVASVLVVGGYVASGLTSAIFPYVALRMEDGTNTERLTGVRLVSVENDRAWVLEQSSSGGMQLRLMPGVLVSLVSCSSVDPDSCGDAT